MKLDTYFERDGESGRAILPPAEELQREEKPSAVLGWMFGAFLFVFAVVTVWAVWP